MRLVYIAGPFNGPTAWHIARNVHAAEEVALRVAELGGMPVVPHSLGRSMAGTLDEKFWLAGTLLSLSRCDGAVFLPTWARSTGATEERFFATRRKLPVWDVADLDAPAFRAWLAGGDALLAGGV